jgi:hypothetical protein
MVIKTSSPGVIVNEVDLTRGTSDGITSNVACLAGPFQKGPVDKITLVETEVDFQATFGDPTDENYEYWFSVDNFLEYGGTCYVVRCDDSVGGGGVLRNAADGPKTDASGNEIKYYVKNADDFEENYFNLDAGMGGLPAKFIAQNPGTWGNNISVAVIDRGADYQLTLKSDEVTNLASGSTVQGPIYFDKSTTLGEDIGTYVKVAAAAETIVAVPQFTNVRTAHAGNKDIVSGGVFGSVTLVAPGATYGLREGTSTRTTTSGSGTAATLTTTVANGVVIGNPVVANGGTGYTVGNVLQIVGSLTEDATVEVKTIDTPGAVIASVALTDAGTNYTTDDTDVALVGGSGSGATIDYTVGAGDVIASVVLNQAGSNYKDGEVVNVTGGNADATVTVTTGLSGVITSVQLQTGGENYEVAGDGNVFGIPTDGGTGSGMTVGYSITGGEVSGLYIATKGSGYTAADTITIVGGDGNASFTLNTISTGSYGGVSITDGDRVLLYGQTDNTENGIYDVSATGSWLRSADAASSADFVQYKTVLVDEGDVTGQTIQYVGSSDPTLGTDSIDFSLYSPYTPIAAGEKVLGYDNLNVATGAEGFVQDVNNGVYEIMVTSGEFALGEYISKNAGSQKTGLISEVDSVGRHILYSFGETDYTGTIIDESIVNTLFVPNILTYDQGVERGWPMKIGDKQKLPIDGDRAKTTMGDTYIWNKNISAWVNDFKPAENDLVSDGSHVFSVDTGEDWYNKQIAFAGIPWFRFASRPTTSPRSSDQNARNDEIHVIVYDRTGDLTGSKGNVIESFFAVSKLSGAKTPEGDNNYYIDVVNSKSTSIFANSDVDTTKLDQINTDLGLDAPGFPVGDGVNSAFIDAMSYDLGGGVNQLQSTLGELQVGYQKYLDENVEDLDYILQGPSLSDPDEAVSKANFVISMAEELKTCIAFVSPPRYAAIDPLKADVITERVTEFFDELSASSYAMFDSGYKYSYDRFNDKQRYVPLNADIAGLITESGQIAEPWYSPAGVVRGQVRNVSRLSFNPSKEQRDSLYSKRVNPVTTFPGEGTILYGDKTALSYSSAFDRVNVRKLFLIIEKEIAQISRSVLFEFNDETTRALFRNNVNPYLRDIQSRRGMTDFLVVCDESNNTPEIVDRNEFVADIYIKPSRSINFVTLNFVATKTGVSFSEAVGLFRR